MRIAIAQISPVVGDFERNVARIEEVYQRACSEKEPARLVLTPELSVSGYVLLDLLDRPEIYSRTERALEKIAQLTVGKKVALAVGHVERNPDSAGKPALNCVSVFENGKRIFTQAKSLLPTYDVFDESRYFEPAKSHSLLEIEDSGTTQRIAFAICEDLWGEDEVGGRKLYGRTPLEFYDRSKPDLVVSVSASPYEFGKRKHREDLHARLAQRFKAPLVYVNQTGATDELLFDGASFVVDSLGRLLTRLNAFDTDFACVDLKAGNGKRSDEEDEWEVLIRGLIVGIRDYFERTKFKLAILGLSGGIDSAVVAALAVRALGAKNVLGVAMPSQYSSSHSLSDAEALARTLGIPFEVRPIKFLFSTANREIGESLGGLAPLAQENLQSRLRGVILMSLSNHHEALVLTTGNKSEIATGYCTLYGDMCGALAPIGDVLKTRVYEIARRLNAWAVRDGNPPPIPESTLTKAPSAELRPGQKDEDSLPPYSALDPFLEDYLERAIPIDELKQKHGPWVSEILRKIEINEYKRRQAAPVLKVSAKAFGVGRRIPIAKVWDAGSKF